MSIYQRIKNKIKSYIIPQKPTFLSKEKIQELVATPTPIIMEIGVQQTVTIPWHFFTPLKILV